MKMGRKMLGIMLAGSLLVVGATSADAMPLNDADGATLEVRVINNHAASVRVFVEDAKGRVHTLGTVRPAEYSAIEVPGELTALGDVKIKVFPAAPAWTSVPADSGVRTQALDADDFEAIQFWVEPDLRRSQVELVRG